MEKMKKMKFINEIYEIKVMLEEEGIIYIMYR